MKRMLFAVSVLAGASTFGNAAEESTGYKCRIKHSLALARDGSPQCSASAEVFHNMEFIVDRASGRILGEAINTRSWLGKREILDKGSSQQSYKLLYTSPPPFVHVNLLQVEEYQAGAEKPFLFVMNTVTHTGTCTPLQ
jgi:hypothetical protein